MPYYSRATSRLTLGRISDPGAWYFLTWCTKDRRARFAEPAALASACSALSQATAADGVIHAAVVMPDHIHVLLELGSRLAIGQWVAKTKAAISRASVVKWQLNFFEHRLRSPTSAEDFAFYIFMNPYSAGVCPLALSWPGWISSPSLRWDFEGKLIAGRSPPEEWLSMARQFARALPVGAD